MIAVACDMPFVSAELLARLLEEGAGADIVVPESESRRGVEPLCAYYATSCIPEIEAQIERGDRRVIGFYESLAVRRIPLAEVVAIGAPEVIFLNVNTPAERERAEAIADARR